MSLFSNKIEMLFNHLIEYSEPAMNTQQEQQKYFNEIAEQLADEVIAWLEWAGKIPPESEKS